MIEDGETWSTASRHIIEDAAAAGVTPDGDPTGEDPTREAQAIARALFAARCAGIKDEFERERYLVPGTFREAYAGVETFVAELADYGYTVAALSTTPAQLPDNWIDERLSDPMWHEGWYYGYDAARRDQAVALSTTPASDRDRFAAIEEAARAWFRSDPWIRLPPGDGLVITDEPFACIACGATTPYIEPDTTQPEWWDQPDHDENPDHEPLCLWVALRAALKGDTP